MKFLIEILKCLNSKVCQEKKNRPIQCGEFIKGLKENECQFQKKFLSRSLYLTYQRKPMPIIKLPTFLKAE